MKRFFAIGGGELRSKTTLEIDKYIAAEAQKAAGEERGNALFFPAAAHDSKPYFNTFRKTYTSECKLKVDVALLSTGEMSREKLLEKLSVANMVYLGGGDTALLITVLKATDFMQPLLDFYASGGILSGLSAGAICFFSRCYSDVDIINGVGGRYRIIEGLGLFDGLVCPHFNLRREDFTAAALQEEYALCIEDDCAVEFRDGEIAGAITAGGKAYLFNRGQLTEIPALNR